MNKKIENRNIKLGSDYFSVILFNDLDKALQLLKMNKNSKIGIFIEKDKKPGPRKPGKGHKEPNWFKPFKQEMVEFKQEMLEFKQTVLLFIKTQSEFNKNQDKFNKTILERLDKHDEMFRQHGWIR